MSGLVQHSRPDRAGRHIYAYCRPLTNQVLYSFTRTLEPSALKQLPDLGANYTPPKLRKDQWRPLFTVSLPDTHSGPKLAQNVMHKLREYRKLHELCWEPPEDLTRNHTEEEIEALRSKLNRRGGSKIETVYEIIRRKKWRMRAKIVMDQKANSIADLAATLLEHDRLGAEITETEEMRLTQERDTIIWLARKLIASSGKELLQEIAERKAALLPEIGASKKLRAAIAAENLSSKKKVDAAQLALQRSEWSLRVVQQAVGNLLKAEPETIRALLARKEAADEAFRAAEVAFIEMSDRQKEADEAVRAAKEKILKNDDRTVEIREAIRAARKTVTEARESNLEARVAAREALKHQQELRTANQKNRVQALLEARTALEAATEPAPEVTKALEQAREAARHETELWNDIDSALDGRASSPLILEMLETREDDIKSLLPRMPGPFVEEGHKAAIFTTEGVTIQWANMLDAEFAEVWPSAVKHEAMGLFRHISPRASRSMEEKDTAEEAPVDGAPVKSTGGPPVYGPVHDLGSFKAASWTKKGLPTWLNEHNMGEKAYKEAMERDQQWAEYRGQQHVPQKPFELNGQSKARRSTAQDSTNQSDTATARKASLRRLNTALVQQINRARGSRMPRVASSRRVKVRFQDAMGRAQSAKKVASAS